MRFMLPKCFNNAYMHLVRWLAKDELLEIVKTHLKLLLADDQAHDHIQIVIQAIDLGTMFCYKMNEYEGHAPTPIPTPTPRPL